MGFEDIMLNERSQRKMILHDAHLYVEPKKYNKLVIQ